MSPKPLFAPHRPITNAIKWMPPAPMFHSSNATWNARTKMFTDGLIAQNAATMPKRTTTSPCKSRNRLKRIWRAPSAAIAKAQAALEQQQATVTIAEENLNNATIVSPIDGMVLSRDSEVGDAVSSILVLGSSATLIMKVGDLNEVYIKGKVDESDIGKVYLGQPARITVESFKDQKFQGSVTQNAPTGDEKDNVTTFEVRVSISNEKHILKAQMTANAEIILEEHKDVLTIPEGAVTYNKDKSTAVQIPDPTNEKGFRKIPITVGISNGAQTEVLKGLRKASR